MRVGKYNTEIRWSLGFQSTFSVSFDRPPFKSITKSKRPLPSEFMAKRLESQACSNEVTKYSWFKATIVISAIHKKHIVRCGWAVAFYSKCPGMSQRVERCLCRKPALQRMIYWMIKKSARSFVIQIVLRQMKQSPTSFWFRTCTIYIPRRLRSASIGQKSAKFPLSFWDILPSTLGHASLWYRGLAVAI
jgi:hypothetical protein